MIDKILRLLSDHAQRYRAVTPAQKQEVLTRFAAVWEQYPELRLGQVIANCYRTQSSIYNVEDFDLIETLEAQYKMARKPRNIPAE